MRLVLITVLSFSMKKQLDHLLDVHQAYRFHDLYG